MAKKRIIFGSDKFNFILWTVTVKNHLKTPWEKKRKWKTVFINKQVFVSSGILNSFKCTILYETSDVFWISLRFSAGFIICHCQSSIESYSAIPIFLLWFCSTRAKISEKPFWLKIYYGWWNFTSIWYIRQI